MATATQNQTELYTHFCESMFADLQPQSPLENILVAEIAAASWRLLGCSNAEAALEDFDEATDKTRRSIERARAAAHSVLHRSMNQLRKLQAGRRKASQPAPVPKKAVEDEESLFDGDDAFDEDGAFAGDDIFDGTDPFTAQLRAFCNPDPSLFDTTPPTPHSPETDLLLSETQCADELPLRNPPAPR